ncbi:hypothetical protein GmHk_08G021811 [Glycine max]|nr:hypothetical protein GmHk_08G021811 [Glycine max]
MSLDSVSVALTLWLVLFKEDQSEGKQKVSAIPYFMKFTQLEHWGHVDMDIRQMKRCVVIFFGWGGLLPHNSQGISQNGRDLKGTNLASLLRINSWGFHNPLFQSRATILDQS